MKERPILFSAPMVRAILDGRKTQTRRVVKGYEPGFTLGVEAVPADLSAMRNDPRFHFINKCPYGQVGDQLWVRETWRVGEDVGEDWFQGAADGDLHVIYDADRQRDYLNFPVGYQWPRNAKETHNSSGTLEHWISYGPIPSIFMPRWASRIQLEITGIRVERLKEINMLDAIAEGVDWKTCPSGGQTAQSMLAQRAAQKLGMSAHYAEVIDYIGGYKKLWESINGAGSWDANPWVWVVEFKRVEVPA